MSILAPTMEEISSERRREQIVPDSSHEVTPNAVYLEERGCVNASQSTQTFHTARSEQVGKSNLEQSMAEKTGATPHPPKHDLISTESEVKDLKKASEDGQKDSDIAKQGLKELGSSGENTKMDDISIDMPGKRQIRTSPFQGRKKKSEELSNQPRAASSPLVGSNYAQGQQEAFSQVPTGIVSSRLRGIATNDLSLDGSSGFHRIMKADHKGLFPQTRRSNTTNSRSHTFEHFPRNPLSRVSQEEDIASLASLAEVIQSQNEVVYLDSSSNVDLIKRPDTMFMSSNLVRKAQSRSLPYPNVTV
jgi:hypothetical protein